MAETVEKKTVFTLESKIEGYVANLLAAQRATKDSTDAIASQFSKVGSGINSLIGITGTLTGILAGGAAFKSIVSETVSWTLETAKLSKTLGVTTQEASVFKVALHSVGVDQDVAAAAALRMAKTLNSNADAFKAIGVDIDAMRKSGASNIEMMVATVQALNQYKGGLDRNQMALSIFSRSWGEVQQLMKLTPAVMEEARETAQRLHLVVGSEGVAAAAEYKKAIRELNLVQESLKIQIGKEMIPVLRDLGVAFGEAGVAAASGFGSGLRYTLRQIAETKLQYTIALKELGVMMDGGPLGSNWFTKKGRAEMSAEIDTLEQMYQHGMETIADRYGDINHALPPAPGGKSAPAKPPTTGEDPALAKENQYVQTYNRLQDERLKGAITGNAALSDTEKKLGEVTLKYQELIALYPEHRAELERNLALDQTQIRNLDAQKKAMEDLAEVKRINAEMDLDEIENGLKKSDAWLNFMGKMSDSQQGRFDQSSMLSQWAASREQLDRQAEQAGKDFMSRDEAKNPEIERLNQERDAAMQHWAMMTDSFEEYERRKTLIEQKYANDRGAIEQREWQTNLGYASQGTNAMMSLSNSLVTLTGKKSKEMFILQKVAAGANAIVNTSLGVTKALATVPYPYDFIVAGMIAAAGAAEIATIATTDIGGSASTSTTSLSGTGGGTVGSPIVTQPASVLPQTREQGTVTIQIMGNVIGDDKWVEENFIPAVNNALSRNVTINFKSQE